MAVRDDPQIVILDTKDWIELSRGHYALAPEFEEIAQIVVEKARSGQVIFPLSVVQFMEIIKNVNQARRQRLAKYVMQVSQGWTVMPALTIFDREIKNFCLQWQGKLGYDLQSFAIRKGLSHMMGAKGTLLDKDPNRPMPEEEKRRILEQLDGQWGLLKLMEIGFPESQIREIEDESKATVDTVEKFRQRLQAIKDKDLRRRTIIADYLVYAMSPRLMQVLSDFPLPITLMIDISTNRQRIEEFFRAIPTMYCHAQLTLYQNTLLRTIQPNDDNDIMSLSIAMPYSDVVVTEKIWHDGIRQTKLGELFETKVLRSVKELGQVIG